MAEVFMCERGQLDDTSKRALKKAGVVVVEVDDMAKCQFMKAQEIVSHSDMLWAAIDAVNHVGSYDEGKGRAQRDKLAKNLLAIMMEHR